MSLLSGILWSLMAVIFLGREDLDEGILFPLICSYWLWRHFLLFWVTKSPRDLLHFILNVRSLIFCSRSISPLWGRSSIYFSFVGQILHHWLLFMSCTSYMYHHSEVRFFHPNLLRFEQCSFFLEIILTNFTNCFISML